EVVLAGTEGIEYSIEGDVVEGETLTVVATAEDGIVLIESEGWALAEDARTATTAVDLDEVTCESPAPAPKPAPAEPRALAVTGAGGGGPWLLGGAAALLLGAATAVAGVVKRRRGVQDLAAA